MKKFASLLLSLALTLSLLTGCGNTDVNSSTSPAESASSSAAAESGSEVQTSGAADKNEAVANQLMKDLTGSYQELWPVILADKYKQVWIDDCAAIVGKDHAQAAYEKLVSMVTGKVYGEDAVKAYKNGGGVYFCGFTQNLSKLEFDGTASVIQGCDKEGKTLFSHTYHYIGMEETRGLYQFESNDADSGEFTYFFFAPDTSNTTYHIEFRYGGDADALGKYDAGEYAYWLASGISADCDQAMIEKCIQLFCTENLAQ
ncbi:hypothetical protein [Caproiciproducens sp.]